MGKLPGFTFYPGDWLRDHIAGCSLAAQGLWLRMMILAHDSDRYGYLTISNGTPMPPETISRRVGVPLDQYVTLLDELDVAGVPSRTPEGIIYSRRMARDNKVRRDTKIRVRKFRERNKSVTHTVTQQYEDENEIDVDVGVDSKKSKSKPSLEEATEYINSRGNVISVDGFMDFYDSVGWKIGNKPMKDWKAAVRTWERRISGETHAKQPTYETAQERRSRRNDAAIVTAMRSRVVARAAGNGQDAGHGSGSAGGGGMDTGIRARDTGSRALVFPALEK